MPGSKLDARAKAKVSAVRAVAGPSLNAVPDKELWRVILRCDEDLDLAITALTMVPRASWVEAIIGK